MLSLPSAAAHALYSLMAQGVDVLEGALRDGEGVRCVKLGGRVAGGVFWECC